MCKPPSWSRLPSQPSLRCSIVRLPGRDEHRVPTTQSWVIVMRTLRTLAVGDPREALARECCDEQYGETKLVVDPTAREACVTPVGGYVLRR
jgi:hypothetical protein